MKIGGKPKKGTTADIDWESVVALLEEYPETPILHDDLEGIANVRSKYNTVRQGGVTALRRMGGVVVPSMRDTKDWSSGKPTGDLWLTWMPDQEQEGVYYGRYLERDRKAGFR